MKKIKTVLMVVAFGFAGHVWAEDVASELDIEKGLSAQYLEKMAAEDGAKKLDGDVIARPIFVSDSNVFPAATDTVKVSYYLTDREGNVIDSSLTRDSIDEFSLQRLIKCWQIAVPTMAVGSLYKITCPSDTAYGDKGAGDVIKPGAALTFRITLFGINKAEQTAEE